MSALTAKAALVDPATIENEGGQAITTRIPRSEVEEAARAEGPAELYLDLATVRDGDREAEQRVTLSWDTGELEQLLKSTTSDDVLFTFKADELARVFDDVEAHGMRQKLAILTVAATAAAGISAGAANAMVMADSGSGGGSTSGTPAFVTDTTSSGPGAQVGTQSSFLTDTTSSGPAAQSGSAKFVTDTTSSGPRAVNIGDGQIVSAPSTGGQSFLSTAGGEAALAGGLALLILGAGFVGIQRHRGGVQPA